MTNIELKFTGPFTIENIENQIDIFKPGIYIWGFDNIVPEKENLFLPFYVGESVSSVFHRIHEHIHDIKYDLTTYRRLHKNYLEMFFKDCSFPLYIDEPGFVCPPGYNKKDDDWFINDKQFMDKVSYWNKKIFLEQIKSELKNSYNILNKNYSMYWLEKMHKAKRDSLDENMANFKIFYSKLDCPKNKKIESKRKFYEIFECLVKFSLQGRTGSMSISIEEAIKRFNIVFECELALTNVKQNEEDNSLHLGDKLNISFTDSFGNTDKEKNNLYLKKSVSYHINTPKVYQL